MSKPGDLPEINHLFLSRKDIVWIMESPHLYGCGLFDIREESS